MLGSSIAVLLLFLGSIHAACTPPNGTDTKFNWWQCTPNDPIKYYNLSLQDSSGKDIYPIRLQQPFVVNALINNTDGPLNNLTTSVKLWQWVQQGSDCVWREVPTLGALNNLIKCGQGIKCPVESGRQNLEITVDLRPLSFAAVLLPASAPYKIEYQIREGSAAQASCLTLETLVNTR
ncbi:unnamed protein product [Gongylonema pulchrum]|uniref:ML domain-containing protein n=1 Tax=Gongylonema pulchrum TaxID=637853 RepID=A0A183EZA8_9BILA|nr:unnamed protein product [Gongylonema pulchrum]VDN45357.1 unnamed protein product [Gongylonema pulchrum]